MALQAYVRSTMAHRPREQFRRANIDMTAKAVEAARCLGLNIHDHLTLGRHGVAIFRTLGLMWIR